MGASSESTLSLCSSALGLAARLLDKDPRGFGATVKQLYLSGQAGGAKLRELLAHTDARYSRTLLYRVTLVVCSIIPPFATEIMQRCNTYRCRLPVQRKSGVVRRVSYREAPSHESHPGPGLSAAARWHAAQCGGRAEVRLGGKAATGPAQSIGTG